MVFYIVVSCVVLLLLLHFPFLSFFIHFFLFNKFIISFLCQVFLFIPYFFKIFVYLWKMCSLTYALLSCHHWSFLVSVLNFKISAIFDKYLNRLNITVFTSNMQGSIGVKELLEYVSSLFKQLLQNLMILFLCGFEKRWPSIDGRRADISAIFDKLENNIWVLAWGFNSVE